MKKQRLSRALALLLAVCLLAGYVIPVQAAGISWREVDIDAPAPNLTDRQVEEVTQDEAYNDADVVRVSIVLDEVSTLQAGFATMNIARNGDAMAYSRNLKASQETMAQTISTHVLGGEKLDVVWNMTLVGNIISANVPYGKLDEIQALDGVREVVIEQRYEPQAAAEEDVVEPQTFISAGMTGAGLVWNNGFTGAGSRIAIIDTGTDTDHQSFNNDAFLYALEENAKAANLTKEEYITTLNLLGKDEIQSVLTELNVYERSPQLTVDDLYTSDKLPFGYNYVDRNVRITHDYDSGGGHGSHVAGIAAANRYIPGEDGTYLSAAEEVFVTGAAPDAQILTMKVFGAAGGIYEADYMAAIEDAIILNCDSINLSLGSNAPGDAYNDLYARLLDFLTTTDTVVVASAGNSGHWAQNAYTGGYLYNDGVGFATGGSPGSYNNSLSVASVDSAGAIGPHFLVDGQVMVYNENLGFGNSAMATLDTSADGSGTEYPFLYVDTLGKESDYAGMDLSGKVVFCSRGETNFADKANAAASKGAIAVVVYNNTTGTFGMDLTGYRYAAPCVSLTQGSAQTVKASGTANTTADGLTYYTGTLKISSAIAAGYYGGGYSMSSFSSWGVPGSLTLKPEISAPGSNILSVNGEVQGTDQYVYMSGTSMAAPQVTGLVALVAQYIRENKLDEKTGLSPRALAQSLLMSTAQPIYEGASGGYYSLLVQGSGLARVDSATTAQSYILVDGQTDGKVKVELGDDPEREGVYSFSFTIHNLTREDRAYGLSADLFTQDVFSNGGEMYLDTLTTDLAVEAAFTSNGSIIMSANDLTMYDLNGDGKGNDQDADYLLEYLLGNVETLYTDGDISGDGKVNTYDAHILLALLEDQACVTVPADGEATVEVTLTLPQQVKAYLDQMTPKGAYLEAFVYAEAVASAEGNVGEVHSIPVLGFYGSWTDPSMYDVDTALERSYGLATRTPYMNLPSTNLFTITYAGMSGEYIFGGNPLSADSQYLPQRNAFNNTSGDVLKSVQFTQIRNAGNALFRIRNTDTNEIYVHDEIGPVSSAYYFVNQGMWQNQRWGLDVAWDGTDANGKLLPNGTPVEISLITAPEYYRNADGSYNWDALGQGAYLSTQFTIDTEAPVISNVDTGSDGELKITAKDTQYIAAVALLNSSGVRTLASATPEQDKANEEVTVSLPLDGVAGKRFLVAVYDYALNSTTYEVTLDLPDGQPRPYFTAFNRTTLYDKTFYNWIGFDAQGGAEVLLGDMMDNSIKAAEFVGGYVFTVSDDGRFSVAEDIDLCNFDEVAMLTSEDYPIEDFRDLAYNYHDGNLYGLYYSDVNKQKFPYLCTIDLLTGSMTVLGELGEDMYCIAIDGDGNFYGAGYGNGILYTYTADTYTRPRTVGDMGSYTSRSLNSMAWDHNEDKLYWAYCASGETSLLEIDIEAAKATELRTLDFSVVGLYIVPAEYEEVIAPTDQVTSVVLNQTEGRLLPGESLRLEAEVFPWTLTDDSVLWSTSDASVATVDQNGKVIAKAVGMATITAAAALDPSKTATCTVEVFEVEKTLNALVWDSVGAIWWSEFKTNELPGFTKLTDTPCDVALATAAYGADGYLYGATMDESTQVSDYYKIDPVTFDATHIGGSREVFYADLAYAPNLDRMMAVYGGYVFLIDEATGGFTDYWQWHNRQNLVGIAYGGSQYNEAYNTYIDTFFLLDMDGNLYMDGFAVIDGEYAYFNGVSNSLLMNLGASTDTPWFNSLYYDGEYVFWSKYSQANGLSELLAWNCDLTSDVCYLGSFGKNVWPVGGLFELDFNPVASQGIMDLSQAQSICPATVGTPEGLELMDSEIATGSLQAVTAAEVQADPEIRPFSISDYDEETGMVTVTIVASQETTNGRMTATYDQALLTLVEIASPLNTSAHVAGAGTVEFAYAAPKALAQNSTLAVLTFRVNDDTASETDVLVNTTERNDQIVNTTQTIVVTFEHKCYAKEFADVNVNAWYHEYLDYVIGNGLMNGMGNNKFAPETSLTRGMLVTTLYRLAGEPEVTEMSSFTDVRDTAYYADAVAWAQDIGVVMGITETTFCPEINVTREQAATFLYRYVTEVLEQEAMEGADLSIFKDAASISEYARVPMAWAVAEEIFEGFPDNTMQPRGSLTRAQMAKLLTLLDQKF